MFDDYNAKMAKVMTEYSIPIKGGEFVAIMGPTTGIPLMKSLYEAVLKRGGHPTILPTVEDLSSIFFKYASDEQIKWVNPMRKFMYEKVDVIFQLEATPNTKAGSRIDPQKMALAQSSSREIFETFITRMGNKEVQWVLMPYPTNGLAQEAGMSLLDYTEFVYKACGFEEEDPIAFWKNVSKRQQKLVDFLDTKSKARIVGPDIELEFTFGGRKWINCDAHLNFPDGEIFTGPIEDSVNGYVNFNLRTMYGGREVQGVQLTYENGKIVKASAERGEDFMLSQLDMDEGARRMGEFAIGTNFGIKEVTGNTLFDEKIGGTIHMAVGRSLPESLGTNISSVHWDMVHDMASSEIYIDDELFYKDGKFVIDF